MTLPYAARIACAAVLGFAALSGVESALAETITLTVGERLARFSLLKPGTHRYLRYTVKNDARNAIDIWSRTIAFENKDGTRALRIVQRWDEVGPRVVLIQDSWFEPDTFRPTTHIRHLERNDETHVGGYRFAPGRVVGLETLEDNERRDFVMTLTAPAYNFEYDMELLQTLPLATGRDFSIPFYDPGVDKPGRYTFKVTGVERISGPDGSPIECWVISADYNTGKVMSRFWIAKSSQILIREETMNEDHSVQIKALLPPEPSDGTG